MLRILCSAIALALSSILWSCGDDAGKVSGPEGNGNPSAGTELLPADSALAFCVQAAISASGATLDRAGLATLTELMARGRGIASLDGIGLLPNLRALDLADNRISDLAPLASLCSLRVADLSANRVSDLTPLSGMWQLEVLLLQGNRVTDITPLLALTRLAEVDLSGNPLADPARVTHLAELRQRGVQVTYLPPVDSTGADEASGLETRTEPMTLAYSDGKGIYLMDYPGGQPVLATRQPGTYGALSWAPDGQSLAVAAKLGGEAAVRIYILRRDGADPWPITPEKPDWDQSAPAWSPDGRHLAYGQRDRGDIRLCVVELGEDAATKVIDLANADVPYSGLWSPWSPSGDALAYGVSSMAEDDLHVYHLQDRGEITAGGGFASVGTPDWSPDGLTLAFAASRPDEHSRIYLWHPGSGAPVTLAADPADSMDYDSPCWEPSGARIAYVARYSYQVGKNYYTRSELRLQPPEENEAQVIPLSQYPYQICWSPDGMAILFVASRGGYTVSIYHVDVGSGTVTDLLPASSRQESIWMSW